MTALVLEQDNPLFMMDLGSIKLPHFMLHDLIPTDDAIFGLCIGKNRNDEQHLPLKSIAFNHDVTTAIPPFKLFRTG